MTPNRRVLSREEAQASRQLIEMSKAAEQAIRRAVECFIKHDLALAQAVRDGDARINEMQREIEHECVTTIARQQPVAGDLRGLVACLYIAGELERIADHGADIAAIATELEDSVSAEIKEGVVALAEKCLQMLTAVMESYQTCDDQRARQIAAQDEVVDSMEKALMEKLFACMRSSPEAMPLCSRALWIIHHLERTADRVTNISERIVFMVTGENVDLNRPAAD